MKNINPIKRTHGKTYLCAATILVTPSKIHACSFYILAFRWTFVHLTLRTTGTALAWKTLAVILEQHTNHQQRQNKLDN